MKSSSISLFLLLFLIACLTGCSTVVTTNTLPDGTKVTVTAKSADPVAIRAALDAAAMIVPVVEALAEKSPAPAVP